MRLLALVETGLPRDQVRHVYLHGARNLRTDLRRDDGPDRLGHRGSTVNGESLAGGVLVVGTGLLGTSVGLALRRAGVDVQLTDQDDDAVAEAAKLGAGRRHEQGARRLRWP